MLNPPESQLGAGSDSGMVTVAQRGYSLGLFALPYKSSRAGVSLNAPRNQ
jgi:hypothetical protein